MIYHIATSAEWNASNKETTYVPAGYFKEGFIHCSTQSQVPGVLERYYAGVKDLLLLHIDETKLTSQLKYEPSTNDELYPHVFGPINKESIVKLEKL